MDTQRHILCFAMLATVFVSFYGTLALLFPVWAVVTIVPALPAVVILAATVCIVTFTAAIKIRPIASCVAGKLFSAMLASKGGFLANVKTSFGGYAFAATKRGAETLRSTTIPIRWIGLGKWLSTIVTNAYNREGSFTRTQTRASLGAIDLLAGRIGEKYLSANRANMLSFGLSSFESASNVGTLGRTTQFVRGSICIGRSRKEATTSRAGRNQDRHSSTSDSVYRELNRGTFLGMNACRQVMTLPKPYTKYNTFRMCCQGVTL